jgi:hypothetical protein
MIWGSNASRFKIVFSSSKCQIGSQVHPPIQQVPGALALGVMWGECEADHLLLSSIEVKNECSYTSTPVCLNGAYRDNFTQSV